VIPWEPLPPELQPLENYAAFILRELGLVEPEGGPTKQQLGILDWMEHGPDRQITVGFRGIAKSTLAAIYASWRLMQDPIEEKILIPSNTELKAVEITTQMLNWFKTIELLQCLAPLPDGRSSAKAFDVGPVIPGRDQAPSVRACGILSSGLTGKRCTCAIPDDIETLNNSITPLKQERLSHAVTELEQIILPDAGQRLPRRIMFLGTPHLETSLYLELSRNRGYKIRYWPARYPNPAKEESVGCYEGGLDPLIHAEVLADPSLVGEPTEAERFGHEELMKRELGNTRTSWQLNYMLNTRLSTLDKYPIRLGDLIVLGLDGKALPETISWGNAAEMRYQELVCTGMGSDRWYYRPAFVGHWIAREDEWRCILAVDPSGRGKDEMAWAVVAELNGNLFVLEVGGTRLGYSDEALKQLALIAQRWRVNLVVTEPNFGDGMFDNLLAPVLQGVYPVGIEPAPRSATMKDRRIVDVLAPLIQQHRLVVSKELLANDYLEAEMDAETGHQRSLAFQLSRITGDRGSLKFYDRIDALSIAAAWFVESVAQDQDRQATARQDELDQAVLDCYFDTAGASADAMAMGVMPTRRGRVAGGIDRPSIRGR
jgi:hypothetical protein